MKDEDKAKEQLIAELLELRQQIVERENLQKRLALKIGEILVEIGFLTRLQLERSLKRQEAEMVSEMLDSKRRRLGEILIESGMITEEELQKGLAEQRRRASLKSQQERC